MVSNSAVALDWILWVSNPSSAVAVSDPVSDVVILSSLIKASIWFKFDYNLEKAPATTLDFPGLHVSPEIYSSILAFHLFNLALWFWSFFFKGVFFGYFLFLARGRQGVSCQKKACCLVFEDRNNKNNEKRLCLIFLKKIPWFWDNWESFQKNNSLEEIRKKKFKRYFTRQNKKSIKKLEKYLKVPFYVRGEKL